MRGVVLPDENRFCPTHALAFPREQKWLFRCSDFFFQRIQNGHSVGLHVKPKTPLVWFDFFGIFSWCSENRVRSIWRRVASLIANVRAAFCVLNSHKSCNLAVLRAPNLIKLSPSQALVLTWAQRSRACFPASNKAPGFQAESPVPRGGPRGGTPAVPDRNVLQCNARTRNPNTFVGKCDPNVMFCFLGFLTSTHLEQENLGNEPRAWASNIWIPQGAPNMAPGGVPNKSSSPKWLKPN